MIFDVSRGVPTNPFEEVMIFGLSRGVPTVPFEEVKKFLKHIDKDMKTRLFLTQLEKVLIFCHRHFFATQGGLRPTFLTQLEKVLISKLKF